MYEYTTYIPPGPQQYIFVNYPKEFNYSIKTIIIKPRELDIIIGMKPQIKIRKKKKRFYKPESVFKFLYEATSEDYIEACEYDFESCRIWQEEKLKKEMTDKKVKIDFFLSDQFQRNKIVEMVSAYYYEHLVYVYLLVKSKADRYPLVSKQELWKFLINCEIIDTQSHGGLFNTAIYYVTT